MFKVTGLFMKVIGIKGHEIYSDCKLKDFVLLDFILISVIIRVIKFEAVALVVIELLLL
jgi:hypothetical protein